MTDRLHTLDALLTKRALKKAEVLIARWLRGTLPADERARILILRARVRLFGGRVDEALLCLQQARVHLTGDDFDTPETLELLGDCYFARYELASVGFADRADAAQALQTYDRILSDFRTTPTSAGYATSAGACC
ncbi:MAG: hypothetical protein HC828_11460 [Blastochloris sp.]|nr:hypothetical protein [Blastochloris sp.]